MLHLAIQVKTNIKRRLIMPKKVEAVEKKEKTVVQKAKAVEKIEAVQEDEPVYFVPKRVSLISDFANVLSWIVLVGFVGLFIVKFLDLRSQLSGQQFTFAQLLKNISLYSYIFTNMIEPLLIGLGLFALLQAASMGLNMLLEADFNAREAKSK